MEPRAELDTISPDDLDAVLAVNQANLPEVGDLTRDRLKSLSSEAAWAPCLRNAAGAPIGFAILLRENANYASPNYAWFSQRHAKFLYVDRIAILEEARGKGFGRAIYEAALARCREAELPALCAEINTVPPNPGSRAFHAKLGFTELERRRPYGGDAEVVMVERAL